MALPTEEGGRNSALYSLCAEGLASGLDISVLNEEAINFCERSKLPPTEGIAVLQSAIKRHITEPFQSFLDSEDEFTLEEIARKFLGLYFNPESGKNLVVYRGTHYEYVGDCYKQIPRHLFENHVQRFLQIYGLCQTTRFRNDVVANINALVQPAYEGSIPFFLDRRETSDSYVALQNGLLSVEGLEQGEIRIEPHTIKYFNLATVPHRLVDTSSCETFLNFINEMIPDEATRDLIQEWCGYNLLPTAKYQKFLILAGPGANGKSVLCLVLELMLGEANCTHLSLDVFNEGRSFSLAEIEGKLANITSEIDASSRASEGTLKKIAAGDPFTAERKFRDPVKVLPTAKLTFATNEAPTFKDTSEGIWRRIFLVLMSKVKDEAHQDRRLVDRNFWKNSGELPGILDWAITGLARLLKNDRFTLPTRSVEALQELREESNLERLFLRDHVFLCPGSRVFDHEIFPKFEDWCKERGYRHSNTRVLNQEIARLHPKAIRCNNPRASGGGRSRYWENLRLESTDSTSKSISLVQNAVSNMSDSIHSYIANEKGEQRAMRVEEDDE